MRGIGDGEVVTGFELGETARPAARWLYELSACHEAALGAL